MNQTGKETLDEVCKMLAKFGQGGPCCKGMYNEDGPRCKGMYNEGVPCCKGIYIVADNVEDIICLTLDLDALAVLV